jgi:hypothetical protein
MLRPYPPEFRQRWIIAPGGGRRESMSMPRAFLARSAFLRAVDGPADDAVAEDVDNGVAVDLALAGGERCCR